MPLLIRTIGKECFNCGIRDTETNRWSKHTQFCDQCHRQISRRGECSICGKPKISRSTLPKPLCPVCDEETLKKYGFIPVEMLCPYDDRSRVLWGNGNRFRDTLYFTATPEQWKTFRCFVPKGIFNRAPSTELKAEPGLVVELKDCYGLLVSAGRALVWPGPRLVRVRKPYVLDPQPQSRVIGTLLGASLDDVSKAFRKCVLSVI